MDNSEHILDLSCDGGDGDDVPGNVDPVSGEVRELAPV